MTNFWRIRFTLGTSIWTNTFEWGEINNLEEINNNPLVAEMFQMPSFTSWSLNHRLKEKNMCVKIGKNHASVDPHIDPNGSVNPHVQVVGQKLENMFFLNDPPLMVANFLPLPSMGWSMFH